jgi:GntR family transcriptional regulator
MSTIDNSGDEKPAAKHSAEALRRVLLADMRDGTLQPGQRLGSERALAERYDVSRTTLRLALDALERAGAISRVRGRGGGTFVREAKIERHLAMMAGLPEYLRRQGYLAGSRVISASLRAADETAALGLDIQTGAPVYELLRVRLANGEPISLEHAQLPADYIPGLLEQPLGGSVMEVLRNEYGIEPARAVERIEIALASRDEADLLGVAAGAPLLSVERTTWSTAGRAFEFSTDLFRGDRTRIVTETTGTRREVAHSDGGDSVEVVSK